MGTRSNEFMLVIHALFSLWAKSTYSQSTHTIYHTTRFTSTVTGSCIANSLPMCKNVSWLPISLGNSTAIGGSTTSSGTSSGTGLGTGSGTFSGTSSDNESGTGTASSTQTQSTSGEGSASTRTGVSTGTGSATTTARPAPSNFFLEGGESFSGYFAVLGEDGNVFLTNVTSASGTGFSINQFGIVSTLQEPVQNLVYHRNTTVLRLQKRQDGLVDWGELLASLPGTAATLGVTERFYFEGKELRLGNGGQIYSLYVQQQNGTFYQMKMARDGSDIPSSLTKLPLTYASTSGTVTLAQPSDSGSTLISSSRSSSGTGTTTAGSGTVTPSSALAYEIITSLGLQSFCSLLLGYFGTVTSTLESTASITTGTTTYILAVSVTSTSIITISESSTSYRTTVYAIESATTIVVKRKLEDSLGTEASLVSYFRKTVTQDTIETPDPLKTFQAAEIRAGCSRAVTAPQTSTEISTSITSAPYLASTNSISTPTTSSTTTSTSIVTIRELTSTLYVAGCLRAEISTLVTQSRGLAFMRMNVFDTTTTGASYVYDTRNALIITREHPSGTIRNTYAWQVSTSVIANAQLANVVSAYQVNFGLIGSRDTTPRDRDVIEAAPNPAPDGTAEPVPLETAGAASSAPSNSAGASSAPSNSKGASSAPSNSAGASSAPSNSAGASSAPSNSAGASSAPSNSAGTSSAPSSSAGASSAPDSSAPGSSGESSGGTPTTTQSPMDFVYFDARNRFLVLKKDLMRAGPGYENRDTFWLCTDGGSPPATTLYLYLSTGFPALVATFQPTLTGCTTFESLFPLPTATS
ncbi:hypothetical protein TWF281_009594 [Arthrobotrys megalospora]